MTHPDLAPTERSKAGRHLRRDPPRTSCCTTPTTRSRRRCRPSSSRPPPTRGCWRSSRPSTAPPVTRRSSTPSSTPPMAGKQVLAVVEIKARFDEVNNISWARKLEHAGVHVVYGIVGLKTHAKLCLVVRQEAEGLVRYCHIGTGNYNPKTARLYEDLGMLTCDPQVGEDLSRLFNQLSGIAPRSRFRRLLVAPRTVRSRAHRGHRRRDRPARERRRRPDPVEDELGRRRAAHRRALPGLAGRGVRRRLGARHLRDPPGGARPERERPGALHAGALPRALADLLVRRLAASRRSTSAAPT
jgi:hypothetical protein